MMNDQNNFPVSYNMFDEELQRGSHLGPYIIRRLLTYGGMSSIYLAYDEHTYDTVVMKVVCTRGLSRDEAVKQVAQIKRERWAMRSLEHPNILPLLGSGQQGPYLFLVMPFVRGGSLQDLMDQEFLSIEETTAIFEQVAHALDYMHGRGLLHRDIKPANILLDEDGTVYLADFGLVTPIGESALDEHGRVNGTPIYMAPELCSGHASVGSDVYALGVLLYQMLTGEVPFDGSSAWDICLQHMHELPLPPSRISTSVSYSVEQIVLRALEKDVTVRFYSVYSFLEAFIRARRVPFLLDKFYAWRREHSSRAPQLGEEIQLVLA
jgi:serine/threonine-protein kinase